MRAQAPGRRSANALRPIGLVVEGDAEFAAFPLLHKNKLVAGWTARVHSRGGFGSKSLDKFLRTLGI